MLTIALPVRSFRHGMKRLVHALPDGQRSSIGRRLASRAAEAASAWGQVVAVTDDPEVEAWAAEAGLDVWADPGGGLDAVGEMVASKSRRWLIIHADLPLIGDGDVAALSTALEGYRTVIAPSYNGGTTALGSMFDTFPFGYGPGSFSRHAARAASLGSMRVLSTPGLALDVDRPHDLALIR